MSAEEFDNVFLNSKLYELARQLGMGVQAGQVDIGTSVITPFVRPVFAEKSVGIGWTVLTAVSNPVQCVRCSTPMVWTGSVWANPIELLVSLDDAHAFSKNLHELFNGTEDRAWCGTWPIFVDRIRDEDKWVYHFQRLSLPIHHGAVVNMLKTLDEFLQHIDTNGWSLQEEAEADTEFLLGL